MRHYASNGTNFRHKKVEMLLVVTVRAKLLSLDNIGESAGVSGDLMEDVNMPQQIKSPKSDYILTWDLGHESWDQGF